MNNICFIPAKGFSRRLPNKNKQRIGGKTLVARAVESSLKANCFKKVCVSSNDDEILNLARDAGAIAISRPQELCNDEVRAKDVLRYHLKELSEKYDSVTMLMPTNPFRTAHHIREACRLFEEKKCLTLISVSEYDFNPCLAMDIRDGKLKPLNEDKFRWEREEMFPKYYHMNGAIFISEYDFFVKNGTFLEENTVPYVMDRSSSVDIDTPEDLLLAEFYLGVTNDRYN